MKLLRKVEKWVDAEFKKAQNIMYSDIFVDRGIYMLQINFIFGILDDIDIAIYNKRKKIFK